MPVRFLKGVIYRVNVSPDMAASTDMRLVCVQLMHELQTRGGSLTRLMPVAQQRVSESQQAQLQAWTYGFCRFSGELVGLVDQLLDKPLKAKDLDVYLLMQLGIFQLRHTSTATHAAVDETVKTTKRLKKPWARGLVNAVLRNYQRNVASLEKNLGESALWSHPDWLLQIIKADWPAQWQSICQANNTQGPMTLRVNRLRADRDDYLQQLQAVDLDASKVPDAPSALQLVAPGAVQQLPGFVEGHVSVQDAAAQLAAAYLVEYAPGGGRLLDACSAPGGKTAHALEQQHFTSVLALDRDEDRLLRVAQTIERLNLQTGVTLQAADASDLSQWWDKEPFDAVLLDAPCSGTGVIRRHPDIKLLRRKDDIAELVKVQAHLLDKLWTTLAPGGLLLYATCSILKDENERQVRSFLSRTDDACLAAELRQIMPEESGMDGFFYAPLRKNKV